ncbi:hypothetical protein [Virgibacillus sp. DJP39]|uniref:hypothetical protein n=1 Tax=Virgibacillus sp. DJP39 TaxID=3409790 RepID=UPI003BB547FD
MSSDMNLVLTELKKINDRFIPFEKTLNVLVKDVSGLKEDFFTMKEEFSTIQQDVSGLKEDLSIFKLDMNANHEYLVGEITELRAEVRVVKGQTARNSEFEPKINNINEKVTELESDVKLLKKIVAN